VRGKRFTQRLYRDVHDRMFQQSCSTLLGGGYPIRLMRSMSGFTDYCKQGWRSLGKPQSRTSCYWVAGTTANGRIKCTEVGVPDFPIRDVRYS